MSNLQQKAMLISLSIAYWTGKAGDESVVDEIMAEHKTSRDAHEYKKILLDPAALNKVKAARSRARQYLFLKTSPWIDGGTRILASTLYLEVAEKLREFKDEYETAVATLIKDYPSLKGEARKRLGSLYKEEDFPDVPRLRKKFRWDMSVLPIPSSKDWRVTLNAKTDAEIRKQIDEQVAAAGALVTKDLWQRLFDKVEALAEKMKGSNSVFRDSIIGNIKDLVALLPDMNVTDDPKLEEMRRRIEVDLAKLSPEELREDEKLRKKAGDAADDLLKKMAGYIGKEK